MNPQLALRLKHEGLSNAEIAGVMHVRFSSIATLLRQAIAQNQRVTVRYEDHPRVMDRDFGRLPMKPATEVSCGDLGAVLITPRTPWSRV